MSLSDIDHDLLNKVSQLALAAGDLIMEVYRRSAGFESQQKADNSPVTEADILAHRYLSTQLSALTPHLPVLSEEGELAGFGARQGWQRYWLIDPLDGTKEFVSGNGEFTVNIALINQHKPVLGVVYAPSIKVLYKAINAGLGADSAFKLDLHRDASSANSDQQRIYTQSICSRIAKQQAIRVVSSRHHAKAQVQELCGKIQQQFAPVQSQALGSSLKLCAVAAGEADLYPRFGPTSEWDTAAAQAIVEAAGGSVVSTRFAALTYNNKQSILNPEFYVIGDKLSDDEAHADLSAWYSLLRDFS